MFLPRPLIRLTLSVIIVAPLSASNLTVSWWPSIAARSRHVRVWSFRTCKRWCCWIASNRTFSMFFVGAVRSSVNWERFPWREFSKRLSVNWGILICSMSAARSCALFYFENISENFFNTKRFDWLLFLFLWVAKIMKIFERVNWVMKFFFVSLSNKKKTDQKEKTNRIWVYQQLRIELFQRLKLKRLDVSNKSSRLFKDKHISHKRFHHL